MTVLKKLLSLLLALLLLFSLSACSAPELLSVLELLLSTEVADCPEEPEEPESPPAEEGIAEDGVYTSLEDVSAYLIEFGRLPQNFMTKKEAQALGWVKNSLEPFAPGMCIGGDYFGNYEKRLPTEYSYRECDIDTLGADSRGEKRLIYAEHGRLIYYTEDHYQSFTLIRDDTRG